MTKKEQCLYEATFYEIQRLFPSLAPSHFMMDFERALQNSVRKVFLNVRISGCRFHQNQAIYRKVNTLGLAGLYKENESFHSWVKKLMALVLLPAESIAPTYEMLASEPVQMLTVCDKEKLGKLKSYYNKYWLKQVGSEIMSVFGLRRKRTTILKSITGGLKISSSLITKVITVLSWKIFVIFQLKTVITFKLRIFYLLNFFIVDAPIQCASFYVERIDLTSKLRKFGPKWQ